LYATQNNTFKPRLLEPITFDEALAILPQNVQVMLAHLRPDEEAPESSLPLSHRRVS
jgi:hypothetical protein